MEKIIEFEDSLYGYDPVFQKVDVIDQEFWIDRLTKLPKYRPLLLEKLVVLCQDYCVCRTFALQLLEKAIIECPVIIQRLYKKGVYSFGEICPLIKKGRGYVANVYFERELKDPEYDSFDDYFDDYDDVYNFSRQRCHDDDDDEEDYMVMDTLIQYGFLPNSVEFCLKYDDLDCLTEIINNKDILLRSDLIWNPYEWSIEPKSLRIMPFSAFFGSVKCFKYLLMNNWSLNGEYLKQCVICGGSSELFHLCITKSSTTLSEYIHDASFFNRKAIIHNLIENGACVDSLDQELNSSLHISVKNCHLGIVEILLENGANPNLLNRKRESPIVYGFQNCLTTITEFLINHGAAINTRDKKFVIFIMQNNFCFNHVGVILSSLLNIFLRTILILILGINLDYLHC